MANRKPRKRAYIPPPNELPPVDEDGETVRVERSRPEKARPAKSDPRARPVREYPVPSWGRTLRRLPIYFVLIFVMQYYFAREDGAANPLQTAAVGSILFTILFAPFMHLMDRWAYSRYQKLQARQEGGQGPRAGS